LSDTHFEHDGVLFVRHETAKGSSYRPYVAALPPHVPDEIVSDIESLQIWCGFIEALVPDAVGKILLRENGTIDALMPFDENTGQPQWWCSMWGTPPAAVEEWTEQTRAALTAKGSASRTRWLILATPAKEPAE
jgi:hypothetical protein